MASSKRALGDGFLTHDLQLAVDYFLILGADVFEIAPQAALDVVGIPVERAFEIGVLLAGQLTHVLFEQG